MKRILFIFVFILMIVSLFCSQIVVFAEQSKIEIIFKVGDDTLKINGKDTKVEMPFAVNGVTLVPLRVITEAFGADVNWNSSDRSIVLSYSGVEIKLILDSNEAVIDGNKVILPEVPVAVNGVTMVPLRFITENFGADVKFDEKTSEITVIKDIASDNSIKDYSLILKKTTKGKIGDSYHSWSISLPKKMKITYRSFDGSITLFNADDESYSLSLTIREDRNDTFDSLLMEELKSISSYTILQQEMKNNGKRDFLDIVFKNNVSAYENVLFIKGNKTYKLWLYVSDYNNFTKNREEFKNLLESFDTVYLNDENTEDLSDVLSDGYRPYENKKMKWSIKIPADWDEYKSESKENEVLFNGKDKSAVCVNMYSIEKGLTLDTWLSDELKRYDEEYNKELVKVLKVEDRTINGIHCKTILSTAKIVNNIYYYLEVYAVGQNYRYYFSYVADSENYNDSDKKTMLEDIINSFKFEEPKVEDVGQLLDPNRIQIPDTLRKYEDKQNKISFDISSLWTQTQNGSLIQFSNEKKRMILSIGVEEGLNMKTFISGYEYTLGNSADVTNNLKTTINAKGTSVYKYCNTRIIEDTALEETIYIFQKNKKLYFINLAVVNTRYTEKNKKELNDIWESMRFE